VTVSAATSHSGTSLATHRETAGQPTTPELPGAMSRHTAPVLTSRPAPGSVRPVRPGATRPAPRLPRTVLSAGEVTEATVAVAVWSAREAAVLQSEAADGLVGDPAEAMEALTEAMEAPVEAMEVQAEAMEAQAAASPIADTGSQDVMLDTTLAPPPAGSTTLAQTTGITALALAMGSTAVAPAGSTTPTTLGLATGSTAAAPAVAPVTTQV